MSSTPATRRGGRSDDEPDATDLEELLGLDTPPTAATRPAEGSASGGSPGEGGASSSPLEGGSRGGGASGRRAGRDGDAVGGRPANTPRRLRIVRGVDDRLFRGTARTGGTVVLLLMSAVGVFLAYQGYQAISAAGLSFFTVEAWSPNEGEFGIAAVLFGTVTIAIIAMIVALPLALGAALYISEYAPPSIQPTLIALVDLMAAVPSVVYGLWGMFLLEPAILPVSEWISTVFGWIPIFAVEGFDPADPLATPTVFTASAFIAGIVVAMMIAPIASSIMREAFGQAPLGEREGALALGGTRWGMIGAVVLPFGRGGIIGGTMLGLGRALGETIAVFLIISPVFVIQPRILEKGSNSISALIANRYSEATAFELSALMAAGLVLFLLTLAVNFGASSVIARSRSGAGAEA